MYMYIIDNEQVASPILAERPAKQTAFFLRGSWLVAIGRSPLPQHGYNQTNVRH